MKTFPMFLRMNGRTVVIAGGGEQAAQKCRLILKTEATIRLLAPALDPELAALHRAGRVEWNASPITEQSFGGAALAFICTECAETDAALHALARAAGVLVNVVDRPDLCEAITPSIVDRDPVVVAIGTEGTAPVLARLIKTRLEETLEPRLGDLAALAGRLRDLAASRLSPRARRDLWAWVFGGEVRRTHARGLEAHAARRIKQAIETGEIPTDCTAPVALVGAGPGSSDLITLRGVKRLQEADIIFYDRLIDPEILELARRDAERVYVGKAPGCHSWPQDRINSVLVSAARQGKRVVRLKCGDPGVFARGAEEADALRDAGIDYEIVPGVTSASAAAAALGGFLTERGRTDSLVLTTARRREGDEGTDWLTHIRQGSNVAVYMGVQAAPEIQATLEEAGLADAVAVRIVSNAQRANQQIVTCRADALADTITRENVANPAIIFLTQDRPATVAHHPLPMRTAPDLSVVA